MAADMVSQGAMSQRCLAAPWGEQAQRPCAPCRGHHHIRRC